MLNGGFQGSEQSIYVSLHFWLSYTHRTAGITPLTFLRTTHFYNAWHRCQQGKIKTTNVTSVRPFNHSAIVDAKHFNIHPSGLKNPKQTKTRKKVPRRAQELLLSSISQTWKQPTRFEDVPSVCPTPAYTHYAGICDTSSSGGTHGSTSQSTAHTRFPSRCAGDTSQGTNTPVLMHITATATHTVTTLRVYLQESS